MEDQKYFPFSYCHQWISSALKMMEKYFGLLVGTATFTVFVQVCLSFVPYIGPVASCGMSFLTSYGTLRFMQQLNFQKSGTFEQYINLVFDSIVFKQLQKQIIICLMIGLVNAICSVMKIPYYYVINTISTAAVTFVALATFYSANNADVTFKDGVDFLMDRVTANAFTILVYYILLSIFAFLSILCCVVPFFLYFLPMTGPLMFLVYRTLCEGKTIEEVVADWNGATFVPAPTPQDPPATPQI